MPSPPPPSSPYLLFKSAARKLQKMAEPPDSHALRRPWSLLVTTAMVLATCLFFLSAAAGSLAASWDSCAMVSGLIILPIPLVLGILQYRGTFRYSDRAARLAGILLAIIAGVIWIGVASFVYEGAMAAWHSDFWWVLAILLGAAILNTLAAWVNFKWGQRLRESQALGTLPPPESRFSLRELLLAMATVSIVAGTVGYAVKTSPPQFAEHVSADEAPLDLPKGADDVSYCRRPRGIIAAEFTCDESAFAEWVESGIGSFESRSSGVRLQPITSTHSIIRYTSLMPHDTRERSVNIRDGLYYSWSHEDRGLYAAYDRSTGRGYYYSHSH